MFYLLCSFQSTCILPLASPPHSSPLSPSSFTLWLYPVLYKQIQTGHFRNPNFVLFETESANHIHCNQSCKYNIVIALDLRICLTFDIVKYRCPSSTGLVTMFVFGSQELQYLICASYWAWLARCTVLYTGTVPC